MKLRAIILVLFAKQYAVFTCDKYKGNVIKGRIIKAKSMDFLENAVKFLSSLIEDCNGKKEGAK